MVPISLAACRPDRQRKEHEKKAPPKLGEAFWFCIFEALAALMQNAVPVGSSSGSRWLSPEEVEC